LIRTSFLFLGLHHRDPTRDPDLIRRQADALSGVHGLEEVVHELAHLVVDRRDLGASLPQHGRTQQVERQQTHPAAPGAGALSPTRMMRARSITSVALPLSIVTRSSFTSFTFPMIPPAVGDLVSLLDVLEQLFVLLPRLRLGAENQEVEHQADGDDLEEQKAQPAARHVGSGHHGKQRSGHKSPRRW
jgi:hypothetical protein